MIAADPGRLLQEGMLHSYSHPVPTVFGVTNPYFLRACSKCPNLVTLTHQAHVLLTAKSLSRSLTRDSTMASDRPSNNPRGMQSMLSRKPTLSSLPEVLQGQADGVTLQTGLLCSGHDKQVLTKLSLAADGGTEAAWDAASSAIRSHFYHLTVSFLLPFYDFWGQQCPWAANHQVTCPLCHS